MGGITLDASLRLPVYSKVCTVCVHYERASASFTRRCAAFPDGIPDEIWLGKNDHTQPYKGDKGITYQRRRRG